MRLCIDTSKIRKGPSCSREVSLPTPKTSYALGVPVLYIGIRSQFQVQTAC